MRTRDVAALALGLVLAAETSTWAQGQYQLLDRIAERVIQKYQTSSCEQLAEQHRQHPTGQRAQMEARVVQMLHQNPQMREAFLGKVAAPIANKMFECGFIP